MYGGGFATIPAYLADIFGTKYVGGIHGRLLTAWSAAGVVGPMLLTNLRNNSEYKAILHLCDKCDPIVFKAHFGCNLNDLEAIETLIKAKTISISKIMQIIPDNINVVDPTPYLYDTTMYSMAGLLAVAMISNMYMKPVASKYHMKTIKTYKI